MTRKSIAIALLLLAGCASDALPSNGPLDGGAFDWAVADSGLPDGAMPDLGVLDSASRQAGNDIGFSCAPGTTFCVGPQIWLCTFLGNDAQLVTDCATQDPGVGNSPTNRFVCATDHREGAIHKDPGPACCRNGKPMCVATLANPTFPSFTFWGPDSNAGSPPCLSGPGQSGDILNMDYTTQAGDHLGGSIVFANSVIAVGQTVDWPTFAAKKNGTPDLSNFGITLAGKGVCTTWTGTLSYLSPVPHYHYALDFTCSSGILVGTKFAADFSGDL